jgi:hypothetical protein
MTGRKRHQQEQKYIAELPEGPEPPERSPMAFTAACASLENLAHPENARGARELMETVLHARLTVLPRDLCDGRRPACRIDRLEFRVRDLDRQSLGSCFWLYYRDPEGAR